MQRDLAIEVHDAVKTFGRVRALDGLDLAVRTGEVHGFLGPNGAGKSTTLRALLGLLRTDAGTLRLLGATRGATPPGSTGSSPTFPATCRCGPT